MQDYNIKFIKTECALKPIALNIKYIHRKMLTEHSISIHCDVNESELDFCNRMLYAIQSDYGIKEFVKKHSEKKLMESVVE